VRLPGAGRAVVSEQQIREYLLFPTHPVGHRKASFFRSLGYDRSNWRRLRDDLRAMGREGAAGFRASSPHGRKYVVRGTLVGPKGASAAIVTVWIVPHDSAVPRLVTAYPEAAP